MTALPEPEATRAHDAAELPRAEIVGGQTRRTVEGIVFVAVALGAVLLVLLGLYAIR